MGIFSKNKEKDYPYDDGHNHNLFSDDDFLMPEGEDGIKSWNLRKATTHAPHALTANEVSNSGNTPEEIPMHKAPQSSVYERLKQQQAAATSIEDDYVPSWAKTQPTEEIKSAEDIKPVESEKPIDTIETVPAKSVVTQPKATYQKPIDNSFLSRCKINAGLTAEETTTRTSSSDLAESILHFTPSSTLEPEIEEIKTSSIAEEVEAPFEQEIEAEPEKVAEQPEAKKLEVEVIPVDSDSHIMSTTSKSVEIDNDVKIYGKVVNGEVCGVSDEGEVSVETVIKTKKAAAAILKEDAEKTMLFGDLDSIISEKANLSFDNPDDDYDDEEEGDDDYYEDQTPYYEAEDEALDNIDDYKDLNDAARLRTELMQEKMRQNVAVATSVIASVVLTALATPIGTVFGAKFCSIIGLALFVLSAIVNFNIFDDLKNLAKLRPTFNSCVAITAILTLVQAVVCTFTLDGAFSVCTTAATLLITANCIANRVKTSRILRGLERIANSETKNAVVSVDGTNGKTVASNIIDGEALVLCGKPVTNITDYLKSSNYMSPFDLKAKTILFFGVAIAAIIGLIVGLLQGFATGLSAAVLSLCCCYPACAAFTCEMPMYFSVKRLQRFGAMLAGYKGAYELNLSNVVAINTSDLFPEGSVKLYNMKPLGNVDLGSSLIDAAAVATASNSPLAPIFKDIIGYIPEKDMPKPDGVQYEDKMGISGWFGEKTILIGNRNLMQGHNIEVPPLSVDQKILQAGYFPVYVACNGALCLLFVVKYEVDDYIASELQRLCRTGMNIVVNPQDPNATDMMLCDYFGLPNDAIKVMKHNGRIAYENITKQDETVSSPACFGKDICGFFASVSTAIGLGNVYTILTALFIISAVLGNILLVYLAVIGKMSIITSITFTAFQLLFSLISIIISKVKRP